ncbi:hypothetical protein SAMN05421858_5118 [Haladaptatus litoreus]|uniref:Uncharacterized protein n=1 Tax=Haladaptatus litoreus TaxID=553468 RepID=A0A1N7FJ00_9EURY|nr:hypothetical protein [Haladaptatus litoreus]SIS00342.1 hypothetical protein SAMN05421858_5118 [Haladaptatus litoreus]
MATGYCTHDDVRRALREASLPGDAQQDPQILTDAIVSQTEWFDETYGYHWYESGGLAEDDEGIIPTGPNTRDDEEDIPTHGGFVHGASEFDRYRYRRNSDALLESGPLHDRRRRHDRHKKEEIRLSFGDLHYPTDDSVPAYCRITLARAYVDSLNQLLVVNEDGGFDDWVASDDYEGGVGIEHRGKDYWVRINSLGVSDMYLNVHSMDDDLASFSDAVYVDFDFGKEGIPHNVRRAIANRAGSDMVEEAAIQIPDNSRLSNIDTKAEVMREKADELLEIYE